MTQKHKKFIWIGVGLVLVAVLIWAFSSGHSFTIGNSVKNDVPKTPSSIAGLNCDTAQRRPVAVMMASDPEARPLSGIGSADLVVEMPVTPNGITRFMAVFQCETPKEIGSIRSAREDFIPLAAGFDTVYAHWGGEHSALDQLNQHVTDNINALQFDGTIFYRKSGIKPPHNGFTTLDLLSKQAKDFSYDLTKDFAGYPRADKKPSKNISNIATTITLPYPSPNDVVWSYDQNSNLYSRKRGGEPEVDKNTGKQVSASVIAVMNTTSHILYKGDQYIVVNTTGEGSAEVYQDGVKMTGTWKKDPAKLDSKLYFYNSSGEEIKFEPGKIWIEINPTWQ
ncbi:MAG: DUF3048 domain-containing protein [Candidatus Pacebacteria bacterium]|nr:DUF3048 domain-containing protein [Candidatus Paceibacterota bacterium]